MKLGSAWLCLNSVLRIPTPHQITFTRNEVEVGTRITVAATVFVNGVTVFEDEEDAEVIFAYVKSNGVKVSKAHPQH